MNSRFLSFVDGELLQLLLVRVAETGDVYVCESAAEAVHFCVFAGVVGIARDGLLGSMVVSVRFCEELGVCDVGVMAGSFLGGD